jgi:serine/threonine-protein kinase
VLNFTGLNQPDGMATDLSSNIWVTDTGNNRVVLLPNTNAPQTVLPFTDLKNPHGVAVEPGRGVVYVTDSGNNRVLKLKTDPTTKTSTQSILPFTGLNNPTGVAVDAQGNLYVVDSGNSRVLKLARSFAAQ